MPWMRSIPGSTAVFSTSTSMKTVPSAVICGVTTSCNTALMYWTAMVLLMLVWIGILVPCITVALALFWATSCGLESSLPTPLRFRGGDHVVQGEIRRGVQEGEAAGRPHRRKVRDQRHRASGTPPPGEAAKRRTSPHWLCADGEVTTIDAFVPPVAVAKGKLRADVTREGTRSQHHARLDLDLLRLAVELADEIIQLRHGLPGCPG